MFRSIADQLEGSPEKHWSYRARIVDFFKSIFSPPLAPQTSMRHVKHQNLRSLSFEVARGACLSEVPAGVNF